MTAFVLSESAASNFVTSILYCGIVTSTNTGTAPYWIAGVTVVGKPAATVIISSPRFTRRSPRSGDVRCHECDQVRGGTGVYEGAVAHMKVLCELLLELIRVTSGCKPELQGAVHKVYHLLLSYTRDAYGIRSPSWNSFFFSGYGIYRHIRLRGQGSLFLPPPLSCFQT